MKRSLGIAASGLLFAATGSLADADNPKLSPGKDPGGTAVAVIADGFDYTQSDLASRLARDGEGEAIAHDSVDGDHRPFVKGADGTALALAAAQYPGVRLVIVRANLASVESLARSLKFVTFTPARIVVVPLSAEHRGHLALIAAAAKSLGSLLLVTSVASPTPDERAQADGVANLVLFDADQSPFVAAEAVARGFGCDQKLEAGDSGEALKAQLSARLKDEAAASCKPKTAVEPKDR